MLDCGGVGRRRMLARLIPIVLVAVSVASAHDVSAAAIAALSAHSSPCSTSDTSGCLRAVARLCLAGEGGSSLCQLCARQPGKDGAECRLSLGRQHGISGHLPQAAAHFYMALPAARRRAEALLYLSQALKAKPRVAAAVAYAAHSEDETLPEALTALVNLASGEPQLGLDPVVIFLAGALRNAYSACRSPTLPHWLLAVTNNYMWQFDAIALAQTCAVLALEDPVATTFATLPSAMSYFVVDNDELAGLIHTAGLHLQRSTQPLSLHFVAPVTRRELRVGYLFPSQNPALLYFNSRDVFHNHLLSNPIYVDGCDPAFEHSNFSKEHLRNIEVVSLCGVTSRPLSVNALRLHILVDPIGWAVGSSMDVLTARVAPVQVAYIFPARQSSPFLTASVWDAVSMPPEVWSSQRVVPAAGPTPVRLSSVLYLPFYSPNNHQATMASAGARQPVRESMAQTRVDIEAAWRSQHGQSPLPSRSTVAWSGPCDGVVIFIPSKPLKWDRSSVRAWLTGIHAAEAALSDRCGPKAGGSPPYILVWLPEWKGTHVSLADNLEQHASAIGLPGVVASHFVWVMRTGFEEYMRRSRGVAAVLEPRLHSGHSTAMDLLWNGALLITHPAASAASRIAISAAMMARTREGVAPPVMMCWSEGDVSRAIVSVATSEAPVLRREAWEAARSRGSHVPVLFDMQLWVGWWERGLGMMWEAASRHVVLPR